MADVRAVFVDMDDTFLAPDKSIPPENRALMDELAARGIELVPCTGRHVGGVPEALRTHPCVRYVVASNGAVVHDLRTRQDVRVIAIPHETVAVLYEQLRTYPLAFDVFADGHAYSELARRPYFDQIDVPEGLRAYLKAGRTFLDVLVPAFLEEVGPVTKLSLFFVEEAGARAIREAVAAQDGLYHVQTSASNYEVMRTEATKGSALLWLAERCGWSVGQTIAFGDNNNDVTMIEAAGDGVAMENGEPQVKALADHIAPSAASGGVGRYLKALLDG